ncbi:MAG TPA: hypothetical protein VMY05_00175 [Acidobacteriota bacterium]|nr:hypothetical protein [Acidobacteriota bacterium]
MSNGSVHLPLHLGGQLLNLLVLALGLAAAYFMTIQSLKIELAAKAEGAVVATLDKKLSGFEVFLREGVVSKEQFYRFSQEVENRLTRIEHYLTSQAGGSVGKR